MIITIIIITIIDISGINNHNMITTTFDIRWLTRGILRAISRRDLVLGSACDDCYNCYYCRYYD